MIGPIRHNKPRRPQLPKRPEAPQLKPIPNVQEIRPIPASVEVRPFPSPFGPQEPMSTPMTAEAWQLLQFTQADTNRDGKLSKDEFVASQRLRGHLNAEAASLVFDAVACGGSLSANQAVGTQIFTEVDRMRDRLVHLTHLLWDRLKGH